MYIIAFRNLREEAVVRRMGILSDLSRLCREATASDYYSYIHNRIGRNGYVWDDDSTTLFVSSYGIAKQILDDHTTYGHLPPPTQLAQLCVSTDAKRGYDELANWFLFDSGPNSKQRSSFVSRALAESTKNIAQIETAAIYCVEAILQQLNDGKLDIYSFVQQYFHSCASLAIGLSISDDIVPLDLVAKAVNLLDGKVASRRDLFYGLTAIGQIRASIDYHSCRLSSHFICASDATFAYIAAHESSAYQFVSFVRHCSHIHLSKETLSQSLLEALRIDPPIQMTIRRFNSSLSAFNNYEIPRDCNVAVHIGAANNDPAVFEDPCSFILDRKTSPIVFGFGSRRCPGAGLSQLALRILLSTLYGSTTAIRLLSIRPNHGLNARGLNSAIVRVS